MLVPVAAEFSFCETLLDRVVWGALVHDASLALDGRVDTAMLSDAREAKGRRTWDAMLDSEHYRYYFSRRPQNCFCRFAAKLNVSLLTCQWRRLVRFLAALSQCSSAKRAELRMGQGRGGFHGCLLRSAPTVTSSRRRRTLSSGWGRIRTVSALSTFVAPVC